MLMNIFICTLIMWGLTAIAVVPLANKWFQAALAAQPALGTVVNLESVSNEMEPELQKLYNTKFIQADMLVMGIAGVIAGFSGFPLIGVA